MFLWSPTTQVLAMTRIGQMVALLRNDLSFLSITPEPWGLESKYF